MQKQIGPIQSRPSVIFQEEFILVNGHQISYQQQCLSKTRFFMPQLGIDLPMEADVIQYDSHYFNFYFIRNLLKELQRIVPTTGLKILKEMPDLSEKNYNNLIMRLTLTKIKQYMMYDAAYLYLWQVLSKFGQKNMQVNYDNQLEMIPLSYLDQPYKRMLYMMEHLSTSNTIKEALKLTTRDLVAQYIDSPNFIDILTQKKQKEKKINKYFLSNIISAFRTLLIINRGPQQTEDRFDTSYERIFAKLFKKEALNLIAINFEYLFNFDRRNLMTTLSLIAAEKSQQLWPEVIGKTYQISHDYSYTSSTSSDPSKFLNNNQRNISEMQSISADKVLLPTDNTGTFLLLIINNYYEGDHQNWDDSLLLLDTLIKYNHKQSEAVLIRVFLEICRLEFNRQIINMALVFIRQRLAQKEKNSVVFEQFLLEFVGLINTYIGKQYSRYKFKLIQGKLKLTKQPEKLGKCNGKNLNLFLRAYSTLLEYKMVHIITELDCVEYLDYLLNMSLGRGGIVEGALLVFKRNKDIFLIEQTLIKDQNILLNKAINGGSYKSLPLLNNRQEKMSRFIEFLKKID